jgi:hypothetical protein
VCELPAAPQTVALYLAARADQGRNVSTLALALTAISQAHLVVAGHPSPRGHRLVQETWKGVRRRLGLAPDQNHPVVPGRFSMIDGLPSGLIGLRDRAVILLGFAGASAAPSSWHSTARISHCHRRSRGHRATQQDRSGR